MAGRARVGKPSLIPSLGNAIGSHADHRNVLVGFWAKHPETKASLLHWLHVAKAAAWRNASEVQAAFSKAKALNGERVRFEVAGGDYRLIAAFDFRRGIAFIKFIGTHADYDRIDALTVSTF